jgi:hypothetical protein
VDPLKGDAETRAVLSGVRNFSDFSPQPGGSEDEKEAKNFVTAQSLVSQKFIAGFLISATKFSWFFRIF